MRIMFGLLERVCLIMFLVAMISIIINEGSEALTVLLLMGALYVIFGTIKEELE